MASEQIEFPKIFSIQYTKPGLSKHVNFSVYREPTGITWNGYYKGYRVRVWYTGEFWIVAGYLEGSQACYFRNQEQRCSLAEINQLVQCACFYIDVVSKNKNDDISN